MLGRIRELRANLTSLDAALLTADARLGRAPGPRCPIEVLGRPHVAVTRVLGEMT